MDSAPNSQRIITLLNAHQHKYPNERALLQALKDGRTLQHIFKDLMTDIEPSYIRSWMATEGFSFSNDHQRNRMSLPQLCDFLATGEVMDMLGGQLRLSMYTKLANDKAYGQLGKLVSFLEGKQQIHRATQQTRTKFLLTQRSFWKINEAYQQIDKQKRALNILKEQERPIFQQKMRRFKQLQQQTQSVITKFNQMVTQSTQSKQLSIQHGNRVSELKRQNEQLQIRISQCQRELSRIAPDVRRRRDHLQTRAQQMADKKTFKHSLFGQIKQTLTSYLQQAQSHRQAAKKDEQTLNRESHIINEETQANEQVQSNIATLESQLIVVQNQKGKENNELQRQRGQAEEVLSQLMQLEDELNKERKQMAQQQQSYELQKEDFNQADNYNRRLEQTTKEKQNDAIRKFQIKENDLNSALRQLQQWEQYLKVGLKQYYMTLEQIIDQ